MSKNRLLIGATGLVGRALRQQFDACGAPLRVLARRADNPLPQESWTCVDNLAQAPDALFDDLDSVICALGTTRKQAGSREAFAAVDRDLVLTLARRARAAGATQWLQVSALGARPEAFAAYSRVKGEADAGLEALRFPRLDIVQPSLLLGPRDERRPGEALAQRLMPLLHPLLRGPLRPYRAVRAEEVAARLLALSEAEAPGTYRHLMRP